MEKQDQQKPESRMVAAGDDPQIGVHCLSEFVYCPRAGVCAYEQDEEYEERFYRGRSGRLPIYDRIALEHRLKNLLVHFWEILLVGAVITISLSMAALLLSMTVLYVLAFCVFILSAVALAERGYWISQAMQYLAIWRAARAKLPDPEATEPQPIHWCELITAGVFPSVPAATYRDESWRINGKPWRLIRHGNLRIPVFLYRGNWDGLRRQHFVRMAAYCHLLKVCEGFDSPYGIILRAGTFAAITVPNTPESRKAFHDELIKARKIAKMADCGDDSLAVPVGPSLCRTCPIGKPFVHRRGRGYLRRQVPLTVHGAVGADGRLYHSHCGDRFNSLPPHEKATEKRLRKAQ